MRRITALLCLSALPLTPSLALAGGYHPVGYEDAEGYGQRAYLLVDNDRFSSVQVTVDGRSVGAVAPESQQRFALPIGQHKITVRGGSDVLFSRATLVRPRQQLSADIPAYEGRVTVVNSTGYEGRLLIDGVDHGALAAGADRTLILPPQIGATIELRGDRFLLDSGSARVISGATTRYVADAPSVAEVTVKNPLSVAVRVRLGDRPAVAVQPGGTTAVSAVAVGAVPLSVRLQSGQIIETSSVRVRPYQGARIVIEGPAQAAVAVHNVGATSARIWLDGALVARVGGYDDPVVELPVGSHRVLVRDAGGETLLDQTMAVSAFGANELVFGAVSCTLADSRSYGDDRGFSAAIRW